MSNQTAGSQGRPATLASLLRSRAGERGGKTAFVFLADGEAEGDRLTYAELDGRARAIAAALRESLAPGDRALLLYPPGLEFIAAFFGCLYAGVIAVPAYPPRLSDRKQERLRAIARDAEPKAALTTAPIRGAFAGTERVPELAEVRWIATEELEGSGVLGAEIAEPDPESVAFLQYTSGSTATPKGVMVTHANLLHNERMIGRAFRQDESSVVVGWLPLYHDMGLIGNVLQPLHAGGSCVLMAPVAFLQKPLRWLEAIGRYRGTTSGGPNFAYELCLRKIGAEQREGLDLSSWRLAYNGAEPVRAGTLERFAAAFAPCGFRKESFYPCYGLAEATLFVSGGAAGTVPRIEAAEGDGRPLVSCGQVWEGQRIAVADPETGEELPAGRVGEIWLAGPSVARGYWQNAEATARDFQARLASGEGPYLRTGDLGFLRAGELYVTGRIKDLVILRGRNHYPQDVELTAERSHPDLRPGCGAAFSVEVAGEERLAVVQEVERHRRDGFGEIVEAVRQAVAEEHEVQVYDVVLVRVGTVPKTSSGKIRRRATRELYLAEELAVLGRSAVVAEASVSESPERLAVPSRAALAALEPEERRAAVERFLRERAAAAVGVPVAAIDPGKPLTGLGLDSLSAVELKAAVESGLGVALPLADLLEGAGTAELAAALLPALAREAADAGPALHPGGAELGEQPLSFGQKALWFLDRLAPEGGAYNVAVAARARGLDPAALSRALTALALRHPALRSIFPSVDGAPVRRVLDHPEIDFAVEDAAGWSEAQLAGRLAAEAYRPFDLAHGPLLRVRAFASGGEHALLLAVHHIAVDFASLAVVARDLAALYRQETGGAPAELPPLPFGYADFVRQQDAMLAGPHAARQEDYWRAALAGLPDLDLPADRPRPPVQTWRGGARTLELPPELAGRLRALASGQGGTLFMVLLAAFQAQLARIAGQEDFATGSPWAGRAPELAGAVGYFVNPVALRAELAGDPSFAAHLARTRRTVLAGLEHGAFPFALLAERLRPVRDPARSPLFQVMFLLQQARPGDAPGIATFALGEAGGTLDLGGVPLESLRLEERRAQFDLTLRAAEEAGGRLRASLEYNSDLFDAATAERMLGHFRTLLAGAVEAPEGRVSRLPLLTPEERAEILAWNETAVEHRGDVLLHGLFEEQVARTPEAEALVDGAARLTYAELNHRASRLAERLRSLGVGPEVRVGVRLGRSADLVVALLGVLKAGGAYVPLDPRYPEERLALMLADSGARVVVTGDGVELDRTDPTDRTDPSDPPGPPERPPLPGNLAYLIYTSGSTGRPKAVAIEHRSAALMVQWACRVFAPGELAGVLASTSVAFDLSVFEIFVPLALGGRVILAENALELPRLPAAGEVTLVNTVPSALAELLRGEGLPPSVRTVNLAGEPIPPALAEAVHALGGVRLYNLYGPSEDTTYSTWTRIAPGAAVTIGRPVDGTRAYVLDAHGEPLPVGAPGELLLGGGGLARGYLGRPELTAERFVPDPFGEPGERLYRTGDLVRRLPDGDLEFLGRIDHQVKIRGFRVELGEVEAALAAHPAVREAVVLALPEPEGGRRLAAFVVAREGEGAEPGMLRSWLRERLPEAFVPTAWRILEGLPLSPNGKVDRKALALLPTEGEAPAGGEPRTPVEREVAALMAEALGVAAVGLQDDFFALGGHSLLAARIASRASRLFGVDLPVSVLFQAPTVGALAGRIAAMADRAAPVVPVDRPHEGRQDLPLSYAQQRLWFLDRLRPGSAAYNMPGAAEITGPLDVDALTAALSEAVRRHEALRTRFVLHDGEPVQVVDPPAPVRLEIVDLAGEEADRHMAAEAARPFDLGRGPLLRATLLRLAPERHRLLLTLHHMVADGWSLGLLLDELAGLYGGGRRAAPTVQYADFAVWQRRWLAGDVLDRQLAWWTRELEGAPTVLDLPADRPRPAVRTEQGAVVQTAFPPELADGVRALARQHGATPFMALLAAFQALLVRVTGQEDLLVGSAVAGRTRPEIEGVIGFFANTLVLRGELTGDPTFLEAVAQARRRMAGAWAHQDLPVERLVEALVSDRDPGLTPLFQVVFLLQSAPPALTLPGLEVRRLPAASGTAKWDLTLELTEQEDGLAAAWELSRDLFDEPTVERLAGWFAHLLAGAVEAPERRLSGLPLLGAAELRQLLQEQNSRPTTAPLDVPVHRLFEEQAARAPERIALVLGDRELTYGELNARANRLAQSLIAGGVGPETLVGVLLERSFEMIEAFLAILKAGGAYVPLDPSWPNERRAALIDEAGIRLVVNREFLANLGREGAPSPASRGRDGEGALAYAMFTSGSTGRPKTVGIEHRSIVRLVCGTDFAAFGPDEVFLQLAAPSFDAATLEIWGALLHGARLALHPPVPPSLDELGEVLARHGVTTLWLTAGLFHQVVESRIGILRGVRQLLAGGDVLAPAAVNRVLAELPAVRLINGYGPTENTTFTCCHTVTAPVPPGGSVPVGRAIPGTRVLVADRWLQPVPPLVPGELLAGGAGLARGYLGRPDLTAERFVPDPFVDRPDRSDRTDPADSFGARLYRTGDLVRRRPDGTIEFLGRIDRQVKIRGFRVEPGEIEAALVHHPAVAQAVVLVREGEGGDRRLVAYVVPAGEALPLAGLRAWLGERLPAYLIPGLVVLAALPLTANGKVDRRALAEIAPEPGTPGSAGLDAPRTPVEELIARIWAEVLGVERVGVHDDFFHLGGHSLLATRAVSRIVDALHVDLPLSTFFAAPTVAGLAARLFGAGSEPELAPLVPEPREAPLPLSFAQQRLWFLDRLAPGGAAYNIAVAARLEGELDVAALEWSLGEIVRRHEALRTVFAEEAGRPVQIVQPWAPPALARRDLSNLPAEEDAARPFDLAAGPVVRFVLTALGPREHLLAATFHHIAADGWSLQVFLRELAELYGARAAGRPPELPVLPVQYADYAVWQRRVLTGPALTRPLAFWRRRLADLEPVELPADGPRTPAAMVPARTWPLDLPDALAAALAACAREAGATPFIVLLAGLYALLARLTGQRDLTVGAPVAARHRVEIEGLIGFFANTLPLRADLAGDPSFRALVARVRTVVLEAQAHGELPFERLVEDLQPERAPGRNPLFDVLLAYLSAPAGWTDLPGLVLSQVDLPEAETHFDLAVTVHESAGRLAGTLTGRSDLFEEATLARMATWLRTLLEGALAGPDLRLSGLPLLSAAERAALSASGVTAGPAWEEGLVHSLFAEQARRTPEAPAVEMDGEVLSYADLDARAGRLAARLRALGAGPETPVAVLLERSPELIVSLLAVLRSGGVYLPVDPEYPPARIQLVLADAQARVLVTRSGLAERSGPFDGATVMLDQTDRTDRTDPSDGLPVLPGNPAWLLYTSGSTGRPKGVAVAHGAAVAHLRTMIAVYGVRPGERVLFFSSPSFDISLEQILPGLAAGATIVVRGPELWEPAETAARIAALRLGWVDVPTAFWSRWAQELGEGGAAPAALRLVTLGGEEMPAEGARAWRRSPLSGVRLVNGYGPTEAVVTATVHEVGAGDPSIGRPLPGRAAWVADGDGNLVPDGVPGELLLGGVLARGYLGRPELTAERFVPDGLSGEPGARLYRTGDRVRRRREGTLDFLGRIDAQVKLRGFRIEPGEIEAALVSHPAVREAAVALVADAAGGKRLAAWVAPATGETPAPAELRAFLAERLPDWMLPASFTLLPALPLTPHGKIDRRALPRPPAASGEDGWVAPRNAVEEALAAVWSEVLGAGRIGAHDDFFHLGGHSLLATQLAARVRAVFGAELPLSDLFAAPTLAGMAAQIEAVRSAEDRETVAPPVRRRPGTEAPLSFAQQRLWFLHQLEPESPAYHVSGALHLRGALRPDVLARALEEIVRRHEALRTVFAETEAGPVQRILPPAPLPLPELDLCGLPAPAAEADRLGRAEARRLFGLAAGPLFRAQLLRLGGAEHLLVVVMHHIVSDGWSVGVMMGELAALYAAGAAGAPSPLPELAVQYADFAEWQRRTLRGPRLERQLAWWRGALAEPPVLDLPGDHPRPPVPSGRGSHLPVAWPPGLADGLRALARSEGATLYMVLLAAFATLLGRFSGQDDLTVGSPIANRDRQEIEPLIGCFVNTLALRVRMAGDPGFRELLARVRAVTLGAYDNQGVPFERLVEELAPGRDRAHAPLFQVLLVLQNAPQPPLRLGDLVLEPRELPTGTAKFDLTLSLAEEEGGIAGALEASTDLFEPATAARWMGHLAELLRGAVADPGRRLPALPLLSAGELEQILGAWSGAAEPVPGEEALLLSDLVAAQAARTPHAEAVVGRIGNGEVRLTYGDLLARADRLAGHLRMLGVGPEARVGVCLDRTVNLPVALLAVLRAGGAYVPLDPAYPRERLELLLRDSGARVLVTEGDLAERCGAFGGVVVGVDRTDRSDRSDRSRSSRPAGEAPLPGNLAYLIYTSGSTGTPKAVAIEHRSAVALVRWALGVFPAAELAGVLFSTSVCFDLSVFELFVPLAAGGKVIVAANALELPALPWAGEVTLINTVPSAMAELARGEGFPASVRTVNLAGEPLQGALADAAYALPGVRRVLNLYGPSEDTTYSTWETVPPERRGEPRIGRPVAGTRVYLLDRSGAPVPTGIPGELLLGGAGLARGYLGRPEVTAERFIPDPFGDQTDRSDRSDPSDRHGGRLYRTGDLARWRPDGRLEYLGRIDHQVKIRGFRIELGEIEAALARLPGVAAVVVLPREATLVAFVVGGEGAVLRRELRRSLPEHMVPAVFVALPALPLTPNGKVDRRALGRLPLDPVQSGGERAAPRTPTEELLAALWCEVLGRDRVGVHDSFFELGGHSLLATRLVSRVRSAFGRDLPLGRLFETPTLAEIARFLDAERGGAPALPIVPVPRGGDLPLSFAQERLWFLDRIQPGPAYNVPLALRLRGTLDAARLGRAFGAIVARQEALRTVFVEQDGEPAERILAPAPPEDWPLPAVDLSGLAPAEAETTAAALAAAAGLRPFDLAAGPLFRTSLLRLAATDHLLLLTMHHIVSDGWSLGVLLTEMAAFYGGRPESLPELPVQYADFAVWQKEWLRGEELLRQTAFWRGELAGAPAILDLPTDRPRPLLAGSRGARRTVALTPERTAGLAALARRQGATPFMLLLAAWVTLLHRFSRQADLNVGTPIAGRNRAEVEHLVGFFVNTLVMRADLSRTGNGDPLFPELLATVRRTALAAYDHQDLPFEKLVDELRPERDLSHQPLFQVMFALQNAPLGALELPGLSLEPTELGATIAKFDLTLSLMEQGGALGGTLEWNTDLFDPATTARLAAQLDVLLGGIVALPERRLTDLPLLTAAERHQLLVEWSHDEPEPRGRLLHQLVERHADRDPAAPAVEHEETRWSYGELESRANRLAWFLRGLGVQPEDRVALLVERRAEMIVAMLGVLKAGGAYVPLDPAHPAERLAFMLEDSGARVVLTQEGLLGRLPQTARVVCLDSDWEAIACCPDGRPNTVVSGASLAYVIYTSGSTGRPKGVLVPHEAVAAYSQVCSAVYGSAPGDRNLQFASISFDASVEEIYSSLTRGATLVVRGEVQEGIGEFLERLHAQRITLLQLPTAFWHQLVAAMEAESLRLPEALRVMFIGGEKMLAQRLVSWWPLMRPGFRLINAYGPTEATVAATLCAIPAAVAVRDGLHEVPIGRALSYVRPYVLDRGLGPVPIGVVGELCLGGLGVSRGYLGRPELTAERFIPNPHAAVWGSPGERLYRTGDLVRLLPDGLLEFIGRTDHQVKIRGFRIELGEIEAHLAAHPAVGEVAVLTRPEPSGEVRLLAWAAAKGETAPTPAELRSWLEERLPPYMVPGVIQVLPSLPVNAQGKVDRRALERLAPQARERAEAAAPRNELEAAIAAVWREVFGLAETDPLGVHDNFFDAGGSSLLLVKLHSRLQKALERTFPLVDLFKHPTIAALAASLGTGTPEKPSLDQARARTETRRTSMRQLQQLRDQRRRGR